MKIKELRKICQVPEMHDFNTFKGKIHRFFSIYITRLLIYTPITANQITLSMIFVGLIVALLFATGDYTLSILAAFLFEFNVFLDDVDGEIARYKKTTSTKGIFLDSISEDILMPLVFGGITIGIFQHRNNLIFLIFGISAIIFSFYSSIIHSAKHEAIFRKLVDYSQGKNLEELTNKIVKSQGIQNNENLNISTFKKIFRMLLPWIRGSNSIYIILFAAIFNSLHLVILLYGTLLPIISIILLANEVKIGIGPWEYLFGPYIPKNKHSKN